MSYSIIMEMILSIYSYHLCAARPSLTLKAAVVHACDDQDGALLNTARLLEIQVANHARSAKYMTSETVSPERCCAAFSVGSGPVSDRPSLSCCSSHQPRVSPPCRLYSSSRHRYHHFPLPRSPCVDEKLHVSEKDLNEAIDWYCECLRSVLCFRFTQTWRMKMSRGPLISAKRRWGFCLHCTQIGISANICDCRRPICHVTGFYTTLIPKAHHPGY
ncbi:hypothetical protein CY34DRAFT_415884 [Suillus luteus UH-Slu-Lm8-n1]|uniref:Uncharacterized protein n=1 Tax=Suillus luteus UH-Slu-Lm8-n1 TaxID=930992 RepID=A0A0C9ZKP0_9AGAM|nr:hypothetical protein CY34DRAFT_415884 [Suillus luteus UH-Slu-Lm8-n1]